MVLEMFLTQTVTSYYKHALPEHVSLSAPLPLLAAPGAYSGPARSLSTVEVEWQSAALVSQTAFRCKLYNRIFLLF